MNVHRSVKLMLIGLPVLLLCSAAVALAASVFTQATGSPYMVPNASAVAFSPDGKYAVVTDGNNMGVVYGYTVATNGGLTPVTGASMGSDHDPVAIAFDPTNPQIFALANEQGPSVQIFQITAGGLNQLSIQPTDAAPDAVAFSPDGKYVVSTTTSATVNNIDVFPISSSGVLSAYETPVATGQDPTGIAFNPTGTLVATSDSGDNDISVFTINDSTGALTQLSNSPFGTTGGTGPAALSFSPDGSLLATANKTSNNVSVFSVASGGTLTQVTGSPVASGKAPESLAFSPYGGLLGVANNTDSSVSMYSYSSAGALTPVSGSPIATGKNPEGIAFSPLGGLYATANYGDNDASVYSYPTGPPMATISAPNSGASYPVGQPLTATFSCADGFGPGIVSCDDSTGHNTTSGGTTSLPTSTPGSYTYSVTATDKSGAKQTTSVTYSIVPAATTTTQTTSTSTPTPVLGSVSDAGAVATLPISCTSPSGQSCTGTVTLTAHERKQGATVLSVTALAPHKTKIKITTVKVTVGSGRYTIPAGGKGSVKLTLNATGKKLLARLYKLKATATFSDRTLGAPIVTFAYGRVKAQVLLQFGPSAASTKLSEVKVTRLPHGAKITLTCGGGGCPFARHTATPTGSSANLTALFSGAKLKPGARLTITITAPNAVGEVGSFLIRSNHAPATTESCLIPGAARPSVCR